MLLNFKSSVDVWLRHHLSFGVKEVLSPSLLNSRRQKNAVSNYLMYIVQHLAGKQAYLTKELVKRLKGE